MWRKRGTRDLSRRELALNRVLRTSDYLAVRTIRTSERGIRMGFPQAGNTLAVTVIGVQGRPARAAVTARH